MSSAENLLAWVTEALSGGHWITLHGSGGPGVHVYISDGAGGGAGHASKGAILAGPKGLVGANIAHLSHLASLTHHHAGHVPKGATSHPEYSASKARPKSRVEAGEAFHKATGGATGPSSGADASRDALLQRRDALIHTFFGSTDPDEIRKVSNELATVFDTLGEGFEDGAARARDNAARAEEIAAKRTQPIRAALNPRVAEYFAGAPESMRNSVVGKALIQGFSDKFNQGGDPGILAVVNDVVGFISGAVQSKMSDANQAELAKRILAIDVVDDTSFNMDDIMAGRRGRVPDPAAVAALDTWYTSVSAAGADNLRATYDPDATNGKQDQQKWLKRPLATVPFAATKDLPYGADPGRTARLSKDLNIVLPEAERTLLNANGLHVEVYDGSDAEVDGGESMNGATGTVEGSQAYFDPQAKLIKAFGMPYDAPDIMGMEPELQGDLRKPDNILTHEYDLYVLEHETGHALDDAMARARGLKNGALVGISQYGHATMPVYGVSSLPEWKALFHKYEDNDYIRDYARSSTSEFFAEMHAMYTDPRTRPMQQDHYKDIYDYMEKLQKEYTAYVAAARKGGDHAA